MKAILFIFILTITYIGNCQIYQASDTFQIVNPLNYENGSIVDINKVCYSAGWEWSRAITSTGTCFISGLMTDSRYATYIIGDMQAAVNVDTGVTIPLIATREIFLAKYNKYNQYKWNKHLSSSVSSANMLPASIAVDAADNILIAGKFNQIMNKGIEKAGDTLVPYSAGKYASFVAKYAYDGTEKWVKRVAWGPSNTNIQWMNVDRYGNIYINGIASDTIYFLGTTTKVLKSGVNKVGYIAKFDKDCNFMWAVPFTTTSIANNNMSELKIGASGNVYVAGNFQGSFITSLDTINSVHASFPSFIILKIDSIGVLQWIRMGGCGDYTNGNGLGIDENENVYACGKLSCDTKFDSTGMGLLNSGFLNKIGGYGDVFVVKYTTNGTLVWKRVVGTAPAQESAYSISTFKNKVQLIATFGGTIIFGNDTISSPAPTNMDAVVYIYDINGTALSAYSLYGDTGNEAPNTLYFDSSGSVYLAGSFSSAHLTIGTKILTNGGVTNGFMAKYRKPF